MSEQGRGAGGAPRVLLIGMMGSGKTTVGERLAQRLGCEHLDNDVLVARATGVETPSVLRDRGVQALREAESGALSEALALDPPVVAGVAGGVVEDQADAARLRDGGFVVYLRARVETLAERVGSGEGRPWLQPDPEAALHRLFEGREEKYEEVASLVVDVDERTPDEVVETVLDALGRG